MCEANRHLPCVSVGVLLCVRPGKHIHFWCVRGRARVCVCLLITFSADGNCKRGPGAVVDGARTSFPRKFDSSAEVSGYKSDTSNIKFRSQISSQISSAVSVNDDTQSI